MTHFFVPTKFNKRNELSNPDFFSSSKITYRQLPTLRFFEEIKSIIIMNFYLFFKVLLIRSLPLIFFTFFEVYRAY